ncbi:MAG: Ig-like domain-containing protein, partial [Patescibacteria group bacterium]
MNRAKLSRIAALLAIISLGGVFAFIHPPVVFAQAVDSLVEVGDTTGLGSEDPKVIVARIIRTGLGFLGVIAVLLVLYGGFVWMTAGGNAEKVETAKKILIRAGIGLAIILLSFAVASFILAALLGATSPDGGGGGGGGGGAGGLGGGNTSSFTVTDYSPDSAVAIRNVQLRVTFSKKLDTATINGNIVITNAATGAAVNGTVKIVGNYATFTPSATCPAPNEDRFCFDADT